MNAIAESLCALLVDNWAPIATDRKTEAINVAISSLTALATVAASAQPSNAFTAVGKSRTELELKNIRNAIQKAIDGIGSLHHPAIELLREQNYTRGQLTNVLSGVDAVFAQALESIEGVDDPRGGAPKNVPATLAAKILIDCFQRVTGRDASLPANTEWDGVLRGSAALVPVVEKAFAILGIKASAKAAIRQIVSGQADSGSPDNTLQR